MKIGVTGHRNQRLSLPEDETDEKWTPIQFWIIDELSKFIKTCADNNEPLDLYTGMASGSDIAFAIAGVSMHYINSIKLHCILPCKDYNSSHKYYKFLKLKATYSDYNIEPDVEFYRLLLDIAKENGAKKSESNEQVMLSKEELAPFLLYFDNEDEQHFITEILLNRKYIPQEAVNYSILVEKLKGGCE